VVSSDRGKEESQLEEGQRVEKDDAQETRRQEIDNEENTLPRGGEVGSRCAGGLGL